MPLLEYRCAACEKKSEVLVLAGDDAAEASCPACGSHEVTRLLSTFAAHAVSGGSRDAAPLCGEGACAMPGMCGPQGCGMGEN
ncbi:MAG TPA: zinc ribbon domain-containing protein [Thermoanaerobaculia bacterium]|nr:zinc ribbon domain-containing protein [Thermoanaerobaculia bacterium]